MWYWPFSIADTAALVSSLMSVGSAPASAFLLADSPSGERHVIRAQLISNQSIDWLAGWPIDASNQSIDRSMTAPLS